MLFLVAMVIFIVYHFYIDYSNWSNTGNTFAEGMTNPAHGKGNPISIVSASQSSTGWGGDASRIVRDSGWSDNWGSGKCTHTNGGGWLRAKLDGRYDVTEVQILNRRDCCSDRIKNAKVYVLDGEKKHLCGAVATGNKGWLTVICPTEAVGNTIEVSTEDTNQHLTICGMKVLGNTVSKVGAADEKVPQKGTFISNEGKKWENQIPFKVSKNIYVFGGFDGGWFKMASIDSNGNFIENRHTKESNSIDELTIEIWNSANKGGDYKVEDIIFVPAAPQQSSEATAMNNKISSRAGNVAPMDSNVPQNCKQGCVAPNGPSGNCKNIQQQGNSKKSCPYTCFNPTLEPNKCQYEQDCNSCGTRIFNPDDEPNMPPTAPEITGQPGGTFQDLRNKSNLNTIPILERAIAEGSKNITNFQQYNFGPEKIKQLQQQISMGNIQPPPPPPPTGTQPSVQEQMALDNWTRYSINSLMRIKNQQVPSFVATGPAATFSKDWTPNRNESDSVSPMPTQLALQLQQQIIAGTIPPPPRGSPQAIALTAALGRDQAYNTQTRIQPNASSWGNTSRAPPMQPLASQSPNNPLFTKEIMKTVLENKNLIPADINITQDKQGNFIRIGKGFMQDLSNIRNVSLPNIDNDDFESLGRVIAKIKIQEAEKIDGPQTNVTKQRLINSVNNILAGTTISNSQVDWEAPRTTAKMSTTGMYNDNSNSMLGYGDKATKHHSEKPENGLCLWKGCEKNEKGQPYDSVYSLY